MVILFLVFSIVISVIDAWYCGQSWPETKAAGGFPRLLSWSCAIMSACGFTWAILITVGFIGMALPVPADPNASMHVVHVLSAQTFELMMELGYAAIVIPLICSGLVMTVGAWARFWRRRTFENAAYAGYNTAVDVYNIYNAVELLPDVLSGLGRVIGGIFDGDSDDDAAGKIGGAALTLVVGLVLVSICGGVLLTRALIMASAKSAAEDRRYRRYMDHTPTATL